MTRPSRAPDWGNLFFRVHSPLRFVLTSLNLCGVFIARSVPTAIVETFTDFSENIVGVANIQILGFSKSLS